MFIEHFNNSTPEKKLINQFSFFMKTLTNYVLKTIIFVIIH